MRLPITVSPDCNLSAGPSKNDKGPFVFVDGEPMMIELQGSLETEGGVPLQDGQSIGTLDVSNAVCLSSPEPVPFLHPKKLTAPDTGLRLHRDVTTRANLRYACRTIC